jgi:hypothetical protein
VLTDEGASRLWEILSGQSGDSLADGRLVVRNGSQEASANFDSTPAVDGREITFTATFGEGVANFEWSSRDVVSAEGVVIDRDVADMGRKAAGAVWTVDAVLELAPE